MLFNDLTLTHNRQTETGALGFISDGGFKDSHRFRNTTFPVSPMSSRAIRRSYNSAAAATHR